MASLPVRDPVADHLLTPQNSALVVIDYQPPGAESTVRSMETTLHRRDVNRGAVSRQPTPRREKY